MQICLISEQVYCLGVKIVFKKLEERYCSGMNDQYWGKACLGRVSLENQLLTTFVEAVLCEKGLEGMTFEIVAFASKIRLIAINADLILRKRH